jgi:hypothetical protein
MISPAQIIVGALHIAICAAMQNIESFGAVAAVNTYEQAITNGVAISQAFFAAQNGSTPDDRTVLVPAGSTYWVIPIAGPINGITDVTLLIQGNISARTDNFTIWPINNATQMGWAVFTLTNCINITITGAGNVIGNGYSWWW